MIICRCGYSSKPIKVYCKNCTFYHKNIIDSNIVSCNIKYIKVKKEDPVNGIHIEKKEVTAYHPSNQNKNYDCKYYKRIWWKFWVE